MIGVAATFIPAGSTFGQESARDSLNATLWQQQSVEYRASAIQAWRVASFSLPGALKDKSWTASLEQQAVPVKQWKKLPPAIIVDIDETVLDNTPGQAHFLLDGDGRYSPKLWQAWTADRRCGAVPGAAQFLKEARDKGTPTVRRVAANALLSMARTQSRRERGQGTRLN